MVNSPLPDQQLRVPDPRRLLDGYHRSASTLNLLRAFTAGGYADLDHVARWNLVPAEDSETLRRYHPLAADIGSALRFMQACGVDRSSVPAFSRTEFYTSHEALLLPYEEALCRQDSITGGWFACSAHTLWIGERTRQIDGAHVEFLRGVGNPVGVKLGPSVTAEDAVALCNSLDPDRRPGRVTLIARMGAGRVEESLTPLLTAVQESGHLPVWLCDPMHGNTVATASGRKTRRFTDVVAEVEGFVRSCHRAGVWPGGLHLELTGDDVTECVGGMEEIGEGDLGLRYETTCDPRLNASQSVELAFAAAELFATDKGVQNL
jgi:3-deoxy-7-phosphoheptulonate synthase